MIETQTFKRDHGGRKAPLILCIIISILAPYIDHSLFYVHYYLFVAAIIGYFLSTIDFLTLNSDGLEINLGILSSKKKLFVEWTTIKQIDIIQDPREWRTKTYGITGEGGGGYRPLEEMCLRIQFNNALPSSIQNLIIKSGDSFFNRIFVRDEGETIIILNYLACEYDTICDFLIAYQTGKQLEEAVAEQNEIKTFNYLLLGIPVLINAYNLFR